MVFQLGTPLLDACVLAILCREDAYGYILTQSVKDVINISESTLYPVLRKLQQDKCLTAYDKPYQGRNRRYYKITDMGKERCEHYTSAWNDYKVKVDNILTGGVKVG